MHKHTHVCMCVMTPVLHLILILMTTIYSCLENQLGMVKLSADLKSDQQSDVNWGKYWLVNLYASKMKL